MSDFRSRRLFRFSESCRGYSLVPSEQLAEIAWRAEACLGGNFLYGLSMAYGANNHGSVIKIREDYYIFYHRHTNGTWYSRQGCAERLIMKRDGSFLQAEMTSCGLNGRSLPGRGEYPAYLACNLFTEKHSVYVGEENAPKIMQDGKDGDEETT